MNDNLPLVIANLKANKTWERMSLWLEEIGPMAEHFTGTVIVCPSFPFLSSAHHKIKSINWPIYLGSQDISRFEQGSHTGEVAASQIADLVQFCIIGHSERRQNFGEDDSMLSQKVKNAIAANITPIFCIIDQSTPIPEGVSTVVYEPVEAIGTGHPDSPITAQKVAEVVKSKGQYTFLYGGSVSAENIRSYLIKDVIDGVLVATNSLDPQSFKNILESATF